LLRQGKGRDRGGIQPKKKETKTCPRVPVFRHWGGGCIRSHNAKCGRARKERRKNPGRHWGGGRGGVGGKRGVRGSGKRGDGGFAKHKRRKGGGGLAAQ